MILEEILNSFKELNLFVEKANNGLMAVEQFLLRNRPDSDEEPLDIIFMDYEMPLMNGIEATKFIRSKIFKEGYIDVRVIGCSGDSTAFTEMEINTHHAHEIVGMDECLPKPLTVESVSKCLKKYINH